LGQFPPMARSSLRFDMRIFEKKMRKLKIVIGYLLSVFSGPDEVASQ
jgi:hypothetical protein